MRWRTSAVRRIFSYFLTQLNNVDFVNLGARRRRGGKTLSQVPRITGPVSLRTHQTLNDFHALRKLTHRLIKMTLPGPCTLVDGVADHYYSDERTLAFAFADALNEEIRALAETGCDMVQIDEPSITRLPQQVHTWGVQAMDRAFEGVTVIVHAKAGAKNGNMATTKFCRRSLRARRSSIRSNSPSRICPQSCGKCYRGKLFSWG